MFEMYIGGIICFISTYLGIVGKKYYHQRLKYLTDFDMFLMDIIDDLKYASNDIKCICKTYLSKTKGAFAVDLAKYIDYIDNGIIDIKVQNCFSSKYLRKQDKALLQDFFCSLGKVDYESQMSRLNYAKSRLQKVIQKAQYDDKTMGTLFSKLGLLIGIALMIILV